MSLSRINMVPQRNLPFVLGCTSYVVPADIITNVRALAPLVDDIELVLFDSPIASNMLTNQDVRTLRALANEHGITYTVHLTTQNRAGSSDPDERKRYVASARQVIELSDPLAPRAWIMHLEGVELGAKPRERLSWDGYACESLLAIAEMISCRERLVVENLGYPWQWHKGLADQAGAGLCCDVGHLWLHFRDDWQTQVVSMLPRASVIHLHGVAEAKDHISLRHTRPHDIQAFLDCLWRFKYSGVVTLEVFSETDFMESTQVVMDTWRDILKGH